jgi:hypothetical protein
MKTSNFFFYGIIIIFILLICTQCKSIDKRGTEQLIVEKEKQLEAERVFWKQFYKNNE